MRIAQVSPLFESVPPRLYGGTERVVSYLTEELVRQGHEVTLFASGDSVTAAELVPALPEALRLNEQIKDQMPYQIIQLEQIRRRSQDFDLIHYHTDYLHFPLSQSSRVPTITTMHGRLDLPDLAPVFREFTDMPLVSISESQREPLAWAHWLATVHHGLPVDLYNGQPKRGDYLAFLGRLSREKRPDRAIEIAQRVGMKIRIAAKVDPSDREYFEKEIRPLLSQPGVEYIGEIGEAEKNEFLGNAYALLFPIDWCEPFGLVMIEAMACGTPVIAWRNGSVPEIIEPGLNGYIVESIDEAASAVEQCECLSRAKCRQVFERRFTVERMAQEYVTVFESAIEAHVLAFEGVSAGVTNGRYYSGTGSVLRKGKVLAR